MNLGTDAGVESDTGIAPDTGRAMDAGPPRDASIADASAADTGDMSMDAGPQETGPSVNPGLMGDVYCDKDAGSLAAAYIFGTLRTCGVYKLQNPAQTMAAETDCTVIRSGMVANSCPTSDIVALCEVPLNVTLPGVLLTAIYQSAVTPDVAAVARNGLQTCLGGKVARTNGTVVNAACSGSISVDINAAARTFATGLVCQFKTDGNRSTYTVTAFESDQPDASQITVRLGQDSDGPVFRSDILGTPPVGFIEGLNGFFPTLDQASTPTVTVTTYDAQGARLIGSFGGVTLNSAPVGSTAVFENGTVNLTFSVSP